jgi:hypothetical protein
MPWKPPPADLRRRYSTSPENHAIPARRRIPRPGVQHLRSQELSLRDIAARLVISTGKKKGQHPSPATVMRMLREHDEKAAATDVNLIER